MQDYWDDALKLDHQLCFPMYAAARKVVNSYTPHLKPLGLTYTQYITFLALWEKDGVTMGELGERLFLDNGTLTPMLKKLEKAGYLTRDRDKADERRMLINLTDKGRDLKAEVKDLPRVIGECLPLSAEDSMQLYQLLYKLIEGWGKETE